LRALVCPASRCSVLGKSIVLGHLLASRDLGRFNLQGGCSFVDYHVIPHCDSKPAAAEWARVKDYKGKVLPLADGARLRHLASWLEEEVSDWEEGGGGVGEVSSQDTSCMTIPSTLLISPWCGKCVEGCCKHKTPPISGMVEPAPETRSALLHRRARSCAQEAQSPEP
jgi:hypothetical protein